MVRRMLLLVGAFFALSGVVLLVASAVLTVGAFDFRSEAVSVEGRITDVEQRRDCDEDGGCNLMYTPVIEFSTTGGEVVVFTPNYSTSTQPQVGSTVTVLYPESDPEDARIDNFSDFWLAPVITGGLGLAFTAVGLPLSIIQLRRMRLNAWLRTSGQRLSATIVDVELNRSVRINRRHPWRVIAVGTDPATGAPLRFVSESLTIDPRPALAGARTVDVLVDPQDPGRRYLMDLSTYGIDG